jgi:putative thiamine transport system permease protein
LEKSGAMLRDGLAVKGLRFAKDRAVRAFAIMLMGVPAFALAGGLAALALWSLSGPWRFPDALPLHFTLQGWRQAMPNVEGPLASTLALGVASSLIAVILVILCLLREDEMPARQGFIARNALAILYLPLLIPQAAFLFGLQFLFVSFAVEGRFATVLLAHLVFVIPYVFLSLSDPWRAQDRRYGAISAALGHGPWRTFFAVRGPMLLAAILAAAALGFAVSAAQYLATVLAGAGRITSVTTEAVALASGGNRRIIGVFAMVQTLTPAIAFMLATLVPAWLWRRRRGMAGH